MGQLALWKLDTGWRLAVWLLGLALVILGTDERVGVARAVGVIVIIVSLIPVGYATRVYAQRASKVRIDCLLALRGSNNRFGKWAGRHRRSLELISAPPSMLALREALLASLIDPLRESPAPTLVDMAVPRRQALELLAVDLSTPHRAADEREFLTYARNWWSATTHRLVEHQREVERLLAAAMAQVEELTPPRGLRGAHTDLSSALRDEYVAQTTFLRALIDADSAGAQAAYDDLTAVRTRLRATITDIRKAASSAMRIRRRSRSTM